MSFCKLIGLALMAQLLLGQVVAQERPEGQHRTEGGLVDLDWSFELKAGGKDDQVLDEDGVRGIVPDAVAGFMTPQGLFGTVVVEIEVLDDEAMLTTWLDGLPAGEKRIVERTRFQMGELEGAEVLVEGVVAGEMTVFLRRCILREGYCFQFTIWGPPAKGAEAALRAGAERFQFVDGKVRARWPATALRSDSGPGWRLRDNVYENTAYAIRVGQIPDWVPLTGLLVEAVNPNAYFGLRHERTGAVVLFMATVTTAETMPAMLTDVRQEVESMLGAPLEGGDRDVVISGQKRRFTSHRSPKTKGHRHEFAVWNDGNLCRQAIHWYPERLAAIHAPAIAAVWAATRELNPDERRALIAELRRQPDQQRDVGPMERVRHGTYVHYVAGVQWTAPGTAEWELKMGERGRAIDRVASLVAYHAEHGLTLSLVLDVLKEGQAHAAYHDELIANFGQGGEDRKVRPFAVPEGLTALPVRRDLISTTMRGVRYRFALATVVNGPFVAALVVSGEQQIFDDHQDAVNQTLGGLSLREPQAAWISFKDSVFRDDRVGYSFKVPEGYGAPQNITPSNLDSQGSLVALGTGEGGIMVMGLQFSGPVLEGATRPLFDVMWKALARGVAGVPDETKRESFAGEIAGRPARGMRAVAEDGTALSLLFQTRGGTVLGVGSVGQALPAEKLAQLLELDF